MTGAAEIRPDSAMRRVVDIALTVPALIALLPLMLVITAVVKLTSRGPALYRARRVGRGRLPFHMLKFRSMVVDADRKGPGVSGHQDPRITPVGRLLRATKLDELPQLLNVLKGEMTLIGPRAEAPRYVEHYTQAELSLLEVRPGVTGPGQIFFTTDQAAVLDSATDPEKHYIDEQLHPKLALDLEYLRRRSLATDVKVVLATLGTLIGMRLGRGGL